MSESIFSKAAELIEEAGELAYMNWESTAANGKSCYCTLGAVATAAGLDADDGLLIPNEPEVFILAALQDKDPATWLDEDWEYESVPDWNDEWDESDPDSMVHKRTVEEVTTLLRKTHDLYGEKFPVPVAA